MKLISKSSLEAQIKQQVTTPKTRQVGEIYPEIFDTDKGLTFSIDMKMDIAIIWLGAYETENCFFKKGKCPVCGEETLIPYFCGGSILSGCHIIKFYCTKCEEKFVTNSNIEYFREIKNFVVNNRKNLKTSNRIKNCTVLPTSSAQ
ncbi:hypothetical protein IJ182_09280 [bacterium]|nr:hypothetical protein [bacterium]